MQARADKAPGRDEITFRVWQELWPVIKDEVVTLYWASLELRHVPEAWRTAKIVRGPAEAQQVGLLESKGLSTDFAPRNHKQRPHGGDVEAIFVPLGDIQTAAGGPLWRSRTKVRGAGAECACREDLRGVALRSSPLADVVQCAAGVQWSAHRSALPSPARTRRSRRNGAMDPQPLQQSESERGMGDYESGVRDIEHAGIPQGSPLSPFLCVFYNANLVQSRLEKSGGSIGFVDDYNAWVAGLVQRLTGKCCRHSSSRQSNSGHERVVQYSKRRKRASSISLASREEQHGRIDVLRSECASELYHQGTWGHPRLEVDHERTHCHRGITRDR